MIKKIREAERLPKWYGIFRYDHNSRVVLVAPIPLNMVFQIFWKIFVFFKFHVFKNVLDEAYRAGYKEACDQKSLELTRRNLDALQTGYEMGLREAKFRATEDSNLA